MKTVYEKRKKKQFLLYIEMEWINKNDVMWKDDIMAVGNKYFS